MQKRVRDERGLSTIEIAFSMALLASTMIPIMGAMNKSVDSHREVITREQVEERARKIAQRVKHRLREIPNEALDALPTWPSTAQQIEYETPESFDDQATTGQVNLVVSIDEPH